VTTAKYDNLKDLAMKLEFALRFIEDATGADEIGKLAEVGAIASRIHHDASLAVNQAACSDPMAAVEFNQRAFRGITF